MKYTLETSADKILKAGWKDFIEKHPEGNIFQTPLMFEVYRSSKGTEPFLIATVNEQGEIAALLLSAIQKENDNLLTGRFSARSIISGGPVVSNNDPELFHLILKGYNEKIKSKAIYSQFRNLRDMSGMQVIFEKNGYVFEDHLNIHVDLTKTEEELWKEVHSKRRNEIRRAYREGTEFRVAEDKGSLRDCYSILREVYHSAKIPLADFSFFENLLDHSDRKSGIRIFTAVYEQQIIGCMLALVFRDTIFDMYAGSYRKYYGKYPNDLIPWEVFKWGRANGYRLFDFGGAGKPGVTYGVRDYKKKFGGTTVNFGRFELIHKPMNYKIGKVGLQVWKRLKF